MRMNIVIENVRLLVILLLRRALYMRLYCLYSVFENSCQHACMRGVLLKHGFYVVLRCARI